MPYLSIQTNQSIDGAAQQELMQQASAFLAEQLGKSENYIMVAIQPGRNMLFAGNTAPLAYLKLKSIGLPESITPALSEGLCRLTSDSMDIDQGRIYIEFSNAERHMWGWNGGTF